MSIDVFGRHLRQQQPQQVQQQLLQFKAAVAAYLRLNSINDSDDFDAENHKLRNLADGLAPGDAVNVNILTKMISNMQQSFDSRSKELQSNIEASVEQKLKTLESLQQQNLDTKVKELQSNLESTVQRQSIELLSDIESAVDEKLKTLESALDSKRKKFQSDIEAATERKLSAQLNSFENQLKRVTTLSQTLSDSIFPILK